MTETRSVSGRAWRQRAERAEAALTITTDALEYIVQIADRGARGTTIGVYAFDALQRARSAALEQALEEP